MYVNSNLTCDRMNIILVQFAGMNCKLMTMHMRAGRSGRRRPKKRGKVLQMLYVVVNTCMFSDGYLLEFIG